MQTDPMVPGATVSGPIAVRAVSLTRACDTCVSHEHAYDHTTFVIHGRVEVRYADTAHGPTMLLGEFGPGDYFPTLAHRHHTIKAIAGPALYYCVFSHRDLGGLVAQRYEAETCQPTEKACA